jgi:AhpD family alkylhydroperoxidase
MSLTFKEKELVNVGASVATGCKPCTDYHFKKVREAGATDTEIKQAISDALAVRESAQEIMESHGLKHLGIVMDKADRFGEGKTTRITELVSIAAAFAVNCTSNLEKHVARSRTVGISDEEVSSVLDAAQFIKDEAGHYVEEIVKLEEKNIELQQLLDELKATQAQLVQSEKMACLGKLVAGVVHEMNTPVGAMNSAVDVSIRSVNNILEALESQSSLQELRSNRKLQDSLKALQANGSITLAAGERITKIINSLKSFTHLDEATVQEVDLHQGLDNTLILMEHELGKRIRVVREYGDVPSIFGYPGELNQVFMNLLSNAVQAIRDDGTITIRTFVDDGNIHVEFADTGVGVPEEQMQGLFDPGFTMTGTRVKAGIGLFTSFNILQKHEGHIDVKSKVGKGSTFTVILPTAHDSEVAASEEPARVDPAPRREKHEHRCDRLKNS